MMNNHWRIRAYHTNNQPIHFLSICRLELPDVMLALGPSTIQTSLLHPSSTSAFPVAVKDPTY